MGRTAGLWVELRRDTRPGTKEEPPAKPLWEKSRKARAVKRWARYTWVCVRVCVCVCVCV